jgi:predicted nucleic acid-binding protein
VSEAKDIRKHLFRPAERLLFDTNVWIAIYGPGDPKDWRTRVYTKAFSRILKADCQIFVNVTVISEYINRILRINQELLGINGSLKDFRKSPEYKAVATDVAADVRRIAGIGTVTFADTGFDAMDPCQLMDGFEVGDRDFNDQIIAKLCKNQEWTVVTNDADFSVYDVDVLTANAKLLTS